MRRILPFRCCVLPTHLPTTDRAALRRRCVTYHFVTVSYRFTHQHFDGLSRMRRILSFRDRVLPTDYRPTGGNCRVALQRYGGTYHLLTEFDRPTYRPTYSCPCCPSTMRRILSFRDRVVPADPTVPVTFSLARMRRSLQFRDNFLPTDRPTDLPMTVLPSNDAM